jgi:hypothetical protein
MSFNFEYEIIDLDDDIDLLYRKFKLSFITTVGSNLEYTFKNSSNFCISRQMDVKNLKKFIKCLEKPEKIEELVQKAKEKNFGEVKRRYFDGIALTKNQRLIYSTHTKCLYFELKSFRYDGNFIEYNLNTNEIVFSSENYQYCDDCSCYDCEHFSRFDSSVCMRIPFKLETRETIIEALEELYQWW